MRMTLQRRGFSPIIGLGLLAALVSINAGCVNLVANMVHAIHGNFIPAEYEGMEGKRVAIVCVTDEGLASNATSSILHNKLHAALGANVKDIELVRRSEVQRWLNENGTQDCDYYEIGLAVKADLVLAVEVAGLTLRNGPTLYRGQSDVNVTVYDMSRNGSVAYSNQMLEVAFPQSSGMPVVDTSENKFRQHYLSVVTRKVAGLFYPVDATADYALDATMSSL